MEEEENAQAKEEAQEDACKVKVDDTNIPVHFEDTKGDSQVLVSLSRVTRYFNSLETATSRNSVMNILSRSAPKDVPIRECA